MPNHITNIISAPKEVLDALLDEEGQVDFEGVLPCPPNIEKGDCLHMGPLSPNDEPDGRGIICWYGWNVKHWGTKWNAFKTQMDDGCLRFLTAWAHPLPVIQALSKQFPQAILTVKYADEDFGRNYGDYQMVNEKYLTITPHGEEGTQEACDFATRLIEGVSYRDYLDSEFTEEEVAEILQKRQFDLV